MKNQNQEIVPKKMNEIESLNEIVELNDLDLEIISGGHTVNICVVRWGNLMPEITKDLLSSNLEVNKINLDDTKLLG